MARSLIARIHNPANLECGCLPECWCKRTWWGRAIRWYVPRWHQTPASAEWKRQQEQLGKVP